MATQDITAEQLRTVVHYEPVTGIFRWVNLKGKRAKGVGWTDPSTGYCRIRVAGVSVLAHRLAWLYVHGVWPTGVIDHINHDRTDNRIANLRDVSNQENRQNNSLLSRKSSTGYTGVRDLGPVAGALRYKAVITHGGKFLHIGRFPTEAEAAAAYFGAKQMVHRGFYSLGHESNNILISEA